MTITQSDFLKVLSEQGQYQIPIYQRAYAWENEQCEKLIRDIAEAGTPGNPNHFIGSVILKKEKSSILSLYNVIDGQQRLTSVSLLLLALRRYCLDFPATLQDQMVSCAIKGLFETHLVNQTFKNTSLYYKLQLKAGNDRTEYENLLRNILGNGRLAKNFQFFYDFIKDNKISPQEIYDGIRNAQLALVVLANDENPQLLFEAVNDTGVDLTQVDLIRNWIFMGYQVRTKINYITNIGVQWRYNLALILILYCIISPKLIALIDLAVHIIQNLSITFLVTQVIHLLLSYC